ncbi:sigma-70 family RNA polymerase sigma factor [Candidatus Peregrinibacteria bacterium]|nr:sigma-70 family RNA polymerase sigma factor [Candidatus Peregrinibacteria bacterium]
MPHADSIQEFTQYYEEYKRTIFNYILYRVGFNRDTAEDLTSDIFLKAFQAFDSYDRNRPFKTWIFTIAHNHLVNYYAAKKNVLPLEEAVEVVKEVPATETLDEKMLVSKILHLISKLPVAQQELVTLRYVNDLGNEEIARIVGKEEGAVRTALSRAIATLRDEYNTHFIHPNS